MKSIPGPKKFALWHGQRELIALLLLAITLYLLHLNTQTAQAGRLPEIPGAMHPAPLSIRGVRHPELTPLQTMDTILAVSNKMTGVLSDTLVTPSSSAQLDGELPGASSKIHLPMAALRYVTPGFRAEPVSGLVTNQDGKSDGFSLVLASQPASDVTLTPHSSRPDLGAVSPASLTFTPANWNIPQTVTVTGLAKEGMTTDETYQVTFDPASSPDPGYNGLAGPVVQLTQLYTGILFKDPFNTERGWVLVDTGVSQSFQNGEKVLSTTRTAKYAKLLAPSSLQLPAERYALQVDARLLPNSSSGARYGFIFNYNNTNSFHAFYISSISQQWWLVKYNGNWITIASGSDAHINPGTAANQLKLVRSGNSAGLYANEALIHTASLSDPITGRVGLWSYSGSTPDKDTTQTAFDNFTLFLDLSISGQVKDGAGNPLQAVTISPGDGFSAFTDASGSYVLKGLAPGTYTLTPSKAGYTFEPAAQQVTVPPSAAGTDFTASLTTYSISGQVKFGTSADLQGVVISDGAGHSTVTDESGSYTLSGLVPGLYTLTPSKTDYSFYPASQPVTVPPIATGKDFICTGCSMVTVPAGNFQMGCSTNDSWCDNFPDESPLHTVYLSAYDIDKYEVTNARYKACVDTGLCSTPYNLYSTTRPSYFGDPAYANYPVIWISLSQASNFCQWEGKRLPTEAEWEKAARGSSDTRIYPWGDREPDCTLANVSYNDQYCVGDTAAVGGYLSGASPYGVMDMAGNVYEMVSDWYQGNYYSFQPPWSNPTGPASGTYKVVRGGAGFDNLIYVRSTYRGRMESDALGGNMGGFRCARSN